MEIPHWQERTLQLTGKERLDKLAKAQSSRQREFHPKPLTKPYGKLSLHTAFVNFKPVTK